MTDIHFGKLQEMPLREAWKHEALEFTPWLADNIGHLSETIGIPLELTGTEVAVETFSADILARNPMDGTVVLIENQLETTDHTHLGQIMTYLAGLEAQSVVWIAPTFREPHLSAIRWLNEHTADGFSFFAVRARVVRIGDSPYAPIFEVVEKPNDWDRKLTSKRREAKGDSELGNMRHAYWSAYAKRHPNVEDVVSRLTYFSCSPTSMPEVTISIWIGQKEGGVFVRGRYGEDISVLTNQLAPHAEWLEQKLDATFGSGKSLLGKKRPGSISEQSTWQELIDWQEKTRQAYLAAFDELATKEAAA